MHLKRKLSYFGLFLAVFSLFFFPSLLYAQSGTPWSFYNNPAASNAMDIFYNTGANPAIRINPNGNVGIGSATNDKLTVSGGDISARSTATNQTRAIGVDANDYGTTSKAVFLQYKDSGVGGNIFGTIPNASLGSLQFQNSNGLIMTNSALPLIFATNSIEAMRLTSTGNVGIGNSSPTEKLAITKDGGPAESTFGLSILSAAGDSELAMGASAAGDYTFIQSFQDANNWTARPLSLMPNGGRVGIGTNAPASLLQVGSIGGATAYMTIEAAATSQSALAFNNAGTTKSLIYRPASSSDMRFWTNVVGDAMTIANSNGFIGIGTTTPIEQVDVRVAADTHIGFGTNSGIAAIFAHNDGFRAWRDLLLVPNGNLGIGVVPTHKLQVSIDDAWKPGGGTWGNSSDRRLKTNIQPITDALDKLTKLEGVHFNWINPAEHGNSSNTQGGFIAQQVEQIFPNWVSKSEPTGADKTLVAPGEKIEGMSLPFEFDALVVESIKQLKAKLDEEKTRNDAQEQEIKELKQQIEDLRQMRK